MIHAKNYEYMSTSVKVMEKKPWPLFFPHTVYNMIHKLGLESIELQHLQSDLMSVYKK